MNDHIFSTLLTKPNEPYRSQLDTSTIPSATRNQRHIRLYSQSQAAATTIVATTVAV
jgi:hypothetical protein